MTTPQGRYEFIETLGTGATSRVDKARDTLIGRSVALKTFVHGFGSGDVQKQFLREAQIIGRLSHPFIVGLYDVGIDNNGVPYFVMEYVEGKTLEKVLDGGPLPLEKAVVWAADLTAAITRAHRAGVIHGDIKPANILVNKDGQVKLGDFGIARFATQVSSSGTLMGTPAYLSPEQIQGQTQDCRSDLFSLGIILYQMTTGVRPFSGSSVSAVCAQIVSITPPPPSHYNPSLPPAFDHVVMRCLAKDPEERYATAAALGASLYPFAHSNEVLPEARVSQTSAFAQSLKRAQRWASARFESATAAMEDLSSRLPAVAATMRTSQSGWLKRPLQSRDLWAAGSAVLILVSLVPIARALRTHSHREVVTLGSVGSPVVSNVVAAPEDRTPITSNAAMINVSSSEVNQAALPATNDALGADNPSTDSNVKDTNAPPVATHALERQRASSAKAQTTRSASDKTNGNSAGNRLVYGPQVLHNEPIVELPATAPAIAQTTLRIDIISPATDQTIAVYAGNEMLVTAPLQPKHPGDTLRFNCPITSGKHDFKVILYRGDKTIYLQKENRGELATAGANTMEIHVSRKAKLLVKHETSLDVVWPSSSPSSSAVTNAEFKPAGALSLR
jgi:serine/threonine-protein kinase